MERMRNPSVTTAEQLLVLRDPPWQHELWRGELRRMTPAGQWHGDLGAELLRRLGNHAIEHRLGRVYNSDTGFVLARDPDTVLAPDVAFVRAARLPKRRTRGYFEGAPDLAIEVRSPSDSRRALTAKARTWLAHGTPEVWVVDPEDETIKVFRGSATPTLLQATDTLRGSGELADFALPLRELFADD